MNKNIFIAVILTVVILGGALFFFLSNYGKFTHDHLKFSFKCPDDWTMLVGENLGSYQELAHVGCSAPDQSATILFQVGENVKNETSEEIFNNLIFNAEQVNAAISNRHSEDINGKKVYFHTVSDDIQAQSVAILATEEYAYSMFLSTAPNTHNAYYHSFEECLNNLEVWE